MTSKESSSVRVPVPAGRGMVIVSTAALLSLTAAMCSAGQWSTWRGDAGLSGSTKEDVAIPLDQKWQYLTDDDFVGTPVGGNGSIFTASHKGWIAALDLKGGEKWKIQLTHADSTGSLTNDFLSGPLAMGDDVLVVCSEAGRVYGLAPADGKVRWTYEAGGGIQGAPVIEDDKAIVLAKAEGVIHCIDVKSGSKVWVSKPEARADGHPAVTGGAVVYGNCKAMLLFLDIGSGKPVGAVEFGEGHEIAGSPACGDGRIFFGTRAGSLMCVDSVKKKRISAKALGEGELFSAPALLGDKVVVAAGNRKLVCLLAEENMWEYNSSGLLGTPVAAGGNVLVISDGKLVVLSGKDGTTIDSVKCAASEYPPALIDGMVVVAGEDNSIYAFAPSRRSGE